MLLFSYSTGKQNIVFLIQSSQDQELIRKVLFWNDNAIILNLVESALLPCATNFTNRKHNNNTGDRDGDNSNNYSNSNVGMISPKMKDDDLIDGTAGGPYKNQQFVQFSSNTGFNNVNLSMWKSCIVNACHLLITIMDDLHENK